MTDEEAIDEAMKVLRLTKLKIEVTSDVSVKVVDVAKLAVLIRTHSDLSLLVARTTPIIPFESTELGRRLQQAVCVLEPSTRLENCLCRAGIRSLLELVLLKEADVKKIKNLGRTVFKELKAKLAEQGLSIGMDLTCITLK